MPQKTCTRGFEYAGRALKEGDAFECDENDVRLLTDLGWIRDAERSETGYETRAMRARGRARQ